MEVTSEGFTLSKGTSAIPPSFQDGSVSVCLDHTGTERVLGGLGI